EQLSANRNPPYTVALPVSSRAGPAWNAPSASWPPWARASVNQTPASPARAPARPMVATGNHRLRPIMLPPPFVRRGRNPLGGTGVGCRTLACPAEKAWGGGGAQLWRLGRRLRVGRRWRVERERRAT